METERAGVFHLGSVEEVDDVLAATQEYSMMVQEQIENSYQMNVITDLQLHDVDELECFR